VHRLGSDEGKDDIITPSLWKVGKELAERILKAKQRAEEMLSESIAERSSSSTSHLSFRDSLDPSSHTSTPSHTHHSLSDTGLHTTNAFSQGAGGDSDESPEDVLSHDTVPGAPTRATQVSTDIDRLLEDLRDSSRGRVGGAGTMMEEEELEKPTTTAGRSTARTKHVQSYGKCLHML
jgi:hypothetical protein